MMLTLFTDKFEKIFDTFDVPKQERSALHRQASEYVMWQVYEELVYQLDDRQLVTWRAHLADAVSGEQALKYVLSCFSPEEISEVTTMTNASATAWLLHLLESR
jgi:aminoglycoside/choline kinase family phosphotransferase